MTLQRWMYWVIRNLRAPKQIADSVFFRQNAVTSSAKQATKLCNEVRVIDRTQLITLCMCNDACVCEYALECVSLI